MLVGNKNFSYPVLNHYKDKSTFKSDFNFEFMYEFTDTKDEVILKDCKCFTNSDLLTKLFNENKIKIICIVECSSCVFRQIYNLSLDNCAEIRIDKSMLNDRVDVSCFAYAVENIKISSEEFIDEYKGEFEIEKHDIIAADDGLSFNVRREDKELNLTHSIFSIIPDHSTTYDGYSVSCEDKRIVVGLNDENYNNYKLIYNIPNYKEIFFSMILVHALEIGLTEISIYLKDDKDIDDALNKYRWLSSVLKAYKLNNGKELTKDAILDYSTGKMCLLAQNLLANPISKSLKIMKETINNGGGDDYEI